MPACASTLSQLLEADLVASGWEPDFIGPHRPDTALFDTVCRSLKTSLTKKLVSRSKGPNNTVLEERALELFLGDNEKCREWSLPEDPQVMMMFNSLKSELDSFFHPDGGRSILLSFGSILNGIGLGRGSNVGVTNVDFYSKLGASRLTYANEGLYELITRAAFSPGSAWSSALFCRPSGLGPRKVVGSVIAFALKNAEIHRTIAVEPLLEMLFQKGIEALLLGRARQVLSLDLETQPTVNRYLARLGSRDDDFATIDLRSASNLNGLRCMKTIIPPDNFWWFEKTRTAFTVLPNGEARELHMLSSMGNAFTFPLQTIVFACCVKVVYDYLGIPFQMPRPNTSSNVGRRDWTWSVFGDDIIVKPRAYEPLVALLSALGHSPNLEKSFSKGPFRESCGRDYYYGYNVRGVYIKHFETSGDYYSAINRLNLWSAEHGIPLPKAVGYIYDSLRAGERKLLVPLFESDTAGIKVPSTMLPRKGYWDKKRGMFRYRVSVPAAVHVDLSTEGSFFKSLETPPVVAQKPREKWKWGLIANYRTKVWYNGDAVLLSAVAGKLRDGLYELRYFGVHTVRRTRFSPSWDWLPSERRVTGVCVSGLSAHIGANLVTVASL